jgi:sulfite exporter TauE/SafE
MTDHLAMLLAWCGPDGPGLPVGLFLAGLAGGPMHCGPMCGPFVLGQTADRLAALPASRLCEMARLRAGLLLPYHLGRLAVYASLGALAGALGALPGIGRASGLFLLAAAVIFLAQAASRLAPSLASVLPLLSRAPAGWVAGIGRLSARVDRSRWSGGLLLGIALGFLPCGFLYAAIAAAASGGSAANGALAMAAFGLGTVPTLVAIGLAGQAAGQAWRRLLLRAAPAVMLLNAAVLAIAAARALFA